MVGFDQLEGGWLHNSHEEVRVIEHVTIVFVKISTGYEYEPLEPCFFELHFFNSKRAALSGEVVNVDDG